MNSIINQFINTWSPKKEVIGIILTGSYAVEIANNHSDIDIRLILDDSHINSIKGFEVVDDYKISFLARPKNTIIRKFNSDFFNNSRIEARIFTYSKVLYSENKVIEKLKSISQYYLNLPFIPKPNNNVQNNLSLYSLFSRLNYLNTLKDDSPFFSYNYFLFMKILYSYYSKYLNYEIIMDIKLENFLTDEGYKDAYNISNFPDQIFIKMWVNYLNLNNINKFNLHNIYNYVIIKTHNFNNNYFRITWRENT